MTTPSDPIPPGLPRTNADKRRAVRMALEVKPDLSDCEIAEHVGVPHQMVEKVREEMDAAANEAFRRRDIPSRIFVSDWTRHPGTEEQIRPYAFRYWKDGVAIHLNLDHAREVLKQLQTAIARAESDRYSDDDRASGRAEIQITATLSSFKDYIEQPWLTPPTKEHNR